MNDLPASLFENPVWHALQTTHRHFAACAGDVCRYPAEVAPFAAVAAPSTAGFAQLRSLLAPEESAWLVGESYPYVPELCFEETLDCLQMILPEQVAAPAPAAEIVPLCCANAAEMVALTTIAFPGFFRSRTCEMGTYYGVRCNGELIAMAGDRLAHEGYREISGVCTHPDHRGKGLAANLIWQLVRMHRRAGLISWLHVAEENHGAIELYRRMGFRTVRTVTANRISRRE